MEDELELIINISAECIALLDDDLHAFPKHLADELIEHIEEIEGYLPRYCTEFREDYIGEVTIPDYNITVEENGSGHIYICFYGYVCAGCRDADHSVEHEERVNFTIDKNAHTITLTYFYPPEREPDEY